MPNSAARPKRFTTSALRRSALVGMHPRRGRGAAADGGELPTARRMAVARHQGPRRVLERPLGGEGDRAAPRGARAGGVEGAPTPPPPPDADPHSNDLHPTPPPRA